MAADITTALVAHYTFDTNTKDLAGGDNDGVATDAQVVDRVLQLNGPGARIVLEKDVDLANHWTIAAWFRSLGNGKWKTLTRSVESDHQVIVDAAGELGTFDHIGGTRFHGSGFKLGGLSPGWHHMAAVGTGGSTGFYVDGRLVGTADFQSQAPVRAIGNSDVSEFRFAEFLDDVRLYNRALAVEDIVALTRPNTVDDHYKVRMNKELRPATGVLSNDAYDAGSTATLLTAPEHSDSFTLNSNGTFVYKPAANFSGTDHFQYRISTEGKLSRTATVTIDVWNPDPGRYISTPSDPWIPNPAHNSTFRTIASGDWDDPDIWSTGRVPTADDNVLIYSEHSVLIRNTSAVAHSIVVFAEGTLRFADSVNTELKVVTLVVLGKLEVGTAEAPIASHVTAVISIRDVAIDLDADPGQYGNGLLALGDGIVRIHGAQRSDSFVRLATEAVAGDTTVILATPVSGWKVGDRLVFPDTRQLHSSENYDNSTAENETIKIAAISSDGKTITLASPLGYSHLGARNGDGALIFLPHIGNMTRNVSIRSANPTGTRGHTLFGDRADVDIRYASFSFLGRTTNDTLNSAVFDSDGNPTSIGTNQVGRYPVHFRRLIGPQAAQENGFQYTFEGNSISCGLPTHNFKWGLAVHSSHYGLIRDNIVYNWSGSGVALVGGSETGNVLEKNFVVRITGTAVREDKPDGKGREGTGFWFHGTHNIIRSNVVSNVKTYAYTYYMEDVNNIQQPAFQGADPAEHGKTGSAKAAVTEFLDNEAYGVSNGLTLWHLGAGFMTTYAVEESVFKNFRLWHVNRYGLYGYGINNVTFDGWVQLGDKALLANASNKPLGLWFGDYLAHDVRVVNANIQNLRTGIYTPVKVGDARDVNSSEVGTFLIKDSYLRNSTNVYTETMYAVTGGGKNLPGREIVIDNVKFDQVNGKVGTGVNQVNIARSYRTSGVGGSTVNLIQIDRVLVRDYQGVEGDNFYVYYAAQAPTFVVPKSTSTLLASPVDGMTNRELWSDRGIAVAGGVSPTAEKRAAIAGFVGPADKPPIAANDEYTVREGRSLLIVATEGVLANDVDPEGELLTATVEVRPQHGTLQLRLNGAFEYVHDGSETLVDTVTYRITDIHGASDTATVTFTIQAINDAPIAVTDVYEVTPGTTLRIDAIEGLLSNDQDAERDTLKARMIDEPKLGKLVFRADGSFIYAPGANFAGTDYFSYRVTDGELQSEIVRVHLVGAVQRVDDSHVRFATVGSWLHHPLAGIGLGGRYREAGTGLHKAAWTFYVVPGLYRVSATWKEASNRATNAPFTIVDGSNELAAVRINQELRPDDFRDQVARWEDLGSPVEVRGNKLVVRLTNDADQYVVADAIRIERLDPLHSADPQPPSVARENSLSPELIESAVTQAIASWLPIHPWATSSRPNVVVADLPGSVLGLASESTNTVWLDTTAAGHGWSTSPFGPAEGQVDLLSVLSHEIGHLLGYDDLVGNIDDVMGAELPSGVTRLPTGLGRLFDSFLLESPRERAVPRGLSTSADVGSHSGLSRPLSSASRSLLPERSTTDVLAAPINRRVYEESVDTTLATLEEILAAYFE